MFVDAIELVAKFTRPIYFISRNYRSEIVQPGAATLFFVNDEGWALTCAHVANDLMMEGKIEQRYNDFKKELASLRGTDKENKIIKQLETKYKLTSRETFELCAMFINCAEGVPTFDIKVHSKYDLALIKFNNYKRLLCDTFPVFPTDTSSLKQGMMLCRLGYPFPEFTNYSYDKTTDKIGWTTSGNANTPQFPIDGMVTRHLIDVNDANKRFYGIEISTPGLKGQSGGPAFDSTGKVWGMQFATNHLDLDFDINQEVRRNGIKKRIEDHAFLHVGYCIHIDVIKEFLLANQIKFNQN